MPINSSDSKALAGLGPPLPGVRVGFVQSLRMLVTYSFQGPGALEVWEPASHKEGRRLEGSLPLLEPCGQTWGSRQSLLLASGCDTVFQSISRAGLLSLELGLETEGCNWAGPDQGLPRTNPSPISSVMKMKVSDAHFLSCFTDAKTTTKWKKLTNWWPWAHRPQTYWSLRIDINPCDTALLPHHQPIRELFTSWSHTLGLPLLIWPLKMLCWNTIWEFRCFEQLVALDSLLGALR